MEHATYSAWGKKIKSPNLTKSIYYCKTSFNIVCVELLRISGSCLACNF